MRSKCISMLKLIPIVEGDGEVDAVPVLLRKILDEADRWDVVIGQPKNAHGVGNLGKEEDVERFVRYASSEPDCSAVIVIRDNEDACAMFLARTIASYIRKLGLPIPVAVVCATKEYEAWFLASLESIAGEAIGRFGLPAELEYAGDVEGIRGVKGWLTRHMPEGRAYKETEDQAPMTARIDLDLAKGRSRSFCRLIKAVDELLTAVDIKSAVVTPASGMDDER